MLFQPHLSNKVKSLSMAYGVFWGIFPAWGFQLAIAIPTAVLLRLHVPLVFASANISIPPMIPLILYGSFWTGALVLGGNRGALSLSKMTDLEVITTNIYQYSLGAVVLAVVAALIAGLGTYAWLAWRQQPSKESPLPRS